MSNMKKFIVGTIILLFSASAFSKDRITYSAADNILVTFLNSPGAEIDTAVIIKNNCRVKFKGTYTFKGEKEYTSGRHRSAYNSNSYYRSSDSYYPTIELNIETNNKKILSHYEDILKNAFGFSVFNYDVHDWYSFPSGEPYIHLFVCGDHELNNITMLSSYKNAVEADKAQCKKAREKATAVADSLYRIHKAKQDSLNAIKIKEEYNRVYTIEIKLDSLRKEYITQNKIREEYIKQIKNTKQVLEYCVATLEQYDKQRLVELDQLERQYIGRLNGEIFSRKKAELDDKWEYKEALIKDKADKANVNLLKYKKDCISNFNNYIEACGYSWEFGYCIVIHKDRPGYSFSKVYDIEQLMNGLLGQPQNPPIQFVEKYRIL